MKQYFASSYQLTQTLILTRLCPLIIIAIGEGGSGISRSKPEVCFGFEARVEGFPPPKKILEINIC